MNAFDIKQLGTQHLGTQIHHFNTIDSTQIYLKDLLSKRQASIGTIVLADHQHSGKGTQGRSWLSLPKPQLLFSILLQPDLPSQKMPIINILTGALLAETLESWNIPAQIKWPNDVYVQSKKTAGILSELVTQNNQAYIILGVGINVDADPQDFPSDLQNTATALSLHAPSVERFALLRDFLGRLEKALYSLTSDQMVSYAQECFERLWIYKNQPIQVEHNRKIIVGTAQQIDTNGALCMKTKSGFEKILSGTVTPVSF